MRKLGRLEEALKSLDRAIAIEPGLADAHANRGTVLRSLKRHDEALAAYDTALALKSDLAEAWLGRGNTFAALLRHGEAVAAYRQALTHKADMVDALEALALLLLSEGNIAEALGLAQRAFAAKETPETKALVASCFCSPLFNPSLVNRSLVNSSLLNTDLGDLRGLLLRALTEPWVRQSELAPACTSLLMHDATISNGTARATKAWPMLLPLQELLGPSGLAKVAEDRLFRTLLESAPVSTAALERFATTLRFNLLAAARSGAAVTEPVLGLYCALARQCYINNYVFTVSEAETGQIRALRGEVVAALSSAADIPPLSLVALAAFAPLHTLPGAEALLGRSWPDAVAAVMAQQVQAPLEEQRLRASMPALTPISAGVSAEVREQYEENPYPQWVKPAPARAPTTVDAFMRNTLPHAPFVEFGKNDDVDILVAGCGTGQHPLDTVSRFKAAKVLAVDLSLSSLCYGQRQTRALGRTGIDFAQADIMQLSSIGRSFDVIEAGGVLHHLADPFAGWRVLLSLLRPHGLMLLGLYSEAARRNVVAARDFIAARGYGTSADDIRRCRQELFDCAPGTRLNDVTRNTDFFSLSECRDLLFHVQEHRLTLPEIAAFLGQNDLQFLGFHLDPQTHRDYARRFPNDIAMTDLSQWHRYETDHPDTFSRMYQFWVQKK